MTQAFNAEQYREHAARRRAALPTETVTLASGSVFELRRPSLQAWMMTGRLPQSLLNLGMKAWKDQGKVASIDPKSDIKTEDAADMMVFMLTVVEEATVSPRFVHVATNDNEIGANDMLPEDFSEIFRWAMQGQGVTGPDGLRQFRGGQERGTSTISSDSEEQRDETEPLTPLERVIQ